MLEQFGAASQLGAAAVLLFTVIQANTVTVMCQGCDPACGCQTEVLEDFERLRGGKLCRNTQRCPRFPRSPPAVVWIHSVSASVASGQEQNFLCVCKKCQWKELCILASLLQFLHVSLTAVYQTGVSSSNPRQSHRVHPVHEAKKPHTPAGYRRPEEAECIAGAARYVSMFHSTCCSVGWDTLHDSYMHYTTRMSVSVWGRCYSVILACW